MTATGDGKARVLDAKTGEELALLEDGHRFLSTTAILTPDGSTLVTAAGDNTVRVWDFHASIEKTRINKTGRKSVLSLSGDGQRFATGENGEKAIRVFDVRTCNLIKRFSPGIVINNGSERSIDITTFALSFDGAFLIAGDSYGDCYLWEIDANRLVAKWRGHFSGVVSTYFTSAKVAGVDELTFITAGREGVVAKWKFAQDSNTPIDKEKQMRIQLSNNQTLIREAFTKRSRNPLTSMRIDETRENVVITTQEKDEGDDSIDTNIEVIHLKSGERFKTELFDTKVQSICFHPNRTGQILLATSPSLPKTATNGRLNASLTNKANSILYRWNTRSEKKPLPYLAGPDLSRVADMSLLPDGNQMLLVGGNGVRQWNLENGKLDREFRSHGTITCAAFSPSSRLVATGGSEKTVKVWDVDTAKAIAKFQNEQFEKISAVYFLDEKNVLIADELGKIFLGNVSKMTVPDRNPLIENGSKVNSICVSPNNQVLFLGGDDGLVNVWNLKTQSKLQTLEHSDRVLCVAISNDSQLLAAGTANNLGHIWDTRTWTKRGEATGHAAPVTSVKFSDDRIRLLSASQDGYASVWDLTPTIPVFGSDVPKPAVTKPATQLTEVYTLTENSEPLIGGFFVNDGRGVATCCVNGLTTIFRGSEIAPALRLSKGSLDLKPNETKPLDPAILLVCPTIDFSNEFEISVSVKDQETDDAIDFVSLSMSEIPDSESGFEVVDQAIMQRRFGDSEPNDVGEKVGEISIAPQEIHFQFSSFARLETIETVLRTLQIEWSQKFDSSQSAAVVYKFKSRRDSKSEETFTISLRTTGDIEKR